MAAAHAASCEFEEPCSRPTCFRSAPLLKFTIRQKRFSCTLVCNPHIRPPAEIREHPNGGFEIELPGLLAPVLRSLEAFSELELLVAAANLSPTVGALMHTDTAGLQRYVNTLLIHSPASHHAVASWLQASSTPSIEDDESSRTRRRPLLMLGGVAACSDDTSDEGTTKQIAVEVVLLLRQPDGPVPDAVAYVQYASDAGWSYVGQTFAEEQIASEAFLEWRGRRSRVRLTKCYHDAWRRTKPPRRRASVLQPGCILLRNAVGPADQQALVDACSGYDGDANEEESAFLTPTYERKDGTSLRAMKLQMRCLGKHWDHVARRYYDRQLDSSGKAVPAIPEKMSLLAAQAVRWAVHAQNGIGAPSGEGAPSGAGVPSEFGAAFAPDVAIINRYARKGSLGLHQDCDESTATLATGAPVVSVSLGDACVFVVGPPTATVGGAPPPPSECQFIRLYSGDVLVFGGASRLMWHGVKAIVANSAPSFLMLPERPCRLNMTFRKY